MVGWAVRADEGGFSGGNGLPWWAGFLTPGVLITIGITLLVIVLAAIVVGRMLYRRVRRNPALADAVLRVRAEYSGGPQQEVLQLRLRLREALDSGQAAVDAALRGSGPQGELHELFRRIQREGVALEGQLRLMESENDQITLKQGLSVARRRVEDVAALVRRLRAAVAADLGEITDDTIAELRTDVDREVAALHAGVQELHHLNSSDLATTSRSLPATDHPSKGERP